MTSKNNNHRGLLVLFEKMSVVRNAVSIVTMGKRVAPYHGWMKGTVKFYCRVMI